MQSGHGARIFVALIGLALIFSQGTALAQQTQVHVLVSYTTDFPVIDGDPSDAAWSATPGIFSDTGTLQAVYDGEQIAILFRMKAPTMSVNTPADWVLKDGSWISWADSREYEAWVNERTQPMAAMFWEIEPFGLGRGCTYTCHAGIRTQTIREGLADYWVLLGRHGTGRGSMENTGWLLGATGARQSERLGFSDDPVDPRMVDEGMVAFVGFAEDLHILPVDQAGGEHPVRPDDEYPFRLNGDQGPEYIETLPVNFVDASVITEAEIAAGEAVPVASLSQAEVEAAWAVYEAYKATVPGLILRDGAPGADVKVGAQWEDGYWTIEICRDLVTGDPKDVQFDDLSQVYTATLTAVSYEGFDNRGSKGFGFVTPIRFSFAPAPRR